MELYIILLKGSDDDQTPNEEYFHLKSNKININKCNLIKKMK